MAPAVSIVLCCDPPAGNAKAAPQCTQKRVPAWLSLPQIAQFINHPFLFDGQEACRKTSAPARLLRRTEAGIGHSMNAHERRSLVKQRRRSHATRHSSR